MARVHLIGLLLLGLLAVATAQDAAATTTSGGSYCTKKQLGQSCTANSDCCSNCCKSASSGRRRSLLQTTSSYTSTVCVSSSQCSGTSGDPILNGFDGSVYNFQGIPFTYWNLLAEKHHVVNAFFVPAVMHDHNGTYITAIGFVYGIHQVAIRVTESGYLNVEVNGKALDLAEGETQLALRLHDVKDTIAGDMLLNWDLYRPQHGNAVTLTTPMLSLNVYAIPPGTEDDGGVPQPAYLNTNFELRQAPAGNLMTGVLGRTYGHLVDHLANGTPVSTEMYDLPVSEVPESRVHGLFERPTGKASTGSYNRRMALQLTDGSVVSFPVKAAAVGF